MKIAFVAPFYGEKATGGAEAECRQTALRLAQRPGVQVDILTTCLRDLAHGITVNAHSPGVSRDGGLTVRRFYAEIFEPGPFAELNSRIIAGGQLSPDEERRFMARNVNSIDLYRYIENHAGEYDFFCFIPYLFGTSVYGSRIAPQKSVLIPCLHDEGYAGLELVREIFAAVKGVVFHTPAEMKIAENIYGPEPRPGQRMLIGEGVETRFKSDGDRFRRRFGIDRDFILYAGRKDETKNVPRMIDWFAAYRRSRPASSLKLVLIGPREAQIPPDMQGGEIIDLGFVADQEKKDAYSAALALCQPSLNESFSIVMMESWVCSRPCLVHGGCAVTREHVVSSGGGLYFESYADFAGALDFLQENPGIADKMGSCGHDYVLENYQWDRVIDRYCRQVFGISD